MSLRVLYCTDTYPPQVNGVSVVTALSVAGLRARGWDCRVVAPRYSPAPPGTRYGLRSPTGVAHGQAGNLIEIASVGFPPYPDIRLSAPAYGSVAAAVADFQPDLVHCATEFTIGRMGQIAARRAGIPSLSSYHTDFSRYTESYGVPWLRSTVSRYLARFHNRSARVYTPSAAARDDLLRAGVERAEVWGCGVDIDMFSPAARSRPFRVAQGVDDQVVLVHVGRLAAEKGVHRILRAFALATELLPAGSIHLFIAGSGPEEPALRAAAPPHVTFLGVLDRERWLPRLYASADAFLFASLTETLGLVVLEAMASGLPVIATPAGGVGDHLRDGVNGLAFPADDVEAMARAIVAVVRNVPLRARLGAGARRTAEALSWEHELDRLDASYREVLGQHPAPLVEALPLGA